MNKSLKGALLSGLVFPGLGHIFLKKRARGLILIFTVLGLLGVVFAVALMQALQILRDINYQGGPIDMAVVINISSQAVTGNSVFLYKVCVYLITGCWIFGVVDAYRIGKTGVRLGGLL